MVRGLQLFRERFEGFEDCYVVIGGAASDLVMDDAGLGFRATKDLDIVLCIEALTAEFVDAFWSFIHDGGYRSKEKADGRREHYRFHSPSREQYPAMLELFSRQPDAIRIPDGVHLTPVPTTSDLSSLSAILIDETYYRWLMDGRVRLQGPSPRWHRSEELGSHGPPGPRRGRTASAGRVLDRPAMIDVRERGSTASTRCHGAREPSDIASDARFRAPR